MSEPKTIKVTNVNPKVATELKNIADNLNVDLSQFLKPKLKEIVDSYSPDMKMPKAKDKEED